MALLEGFISSASTFRGQFSHVTSQKKCRGYRRGVVLPRTFRVSATITESYRSEKKAEDDTRLDSQPAFSWTEQWYAVCIEDNAPIDEPYAFTIFDRELVLFRAAPGRWSVLDDECSHRLAPLSEGRLTTLAGNDNEAVLECAYHGWSFKSCGQCARIPQIENDNNNAAIPRRANVRSYPTAVSNRLIWVWLGEPANADHSLIPIPPGASRYTADQMTVCFSRFVPYGFETLIENVADPEHIHFAHHGATQFMKRSNGGKSNIFAERRKPFRITSMRSSKSDDKQTKQDAGEYWAPCTVFYDVTIPSMGSTLTWFVVTPVTRSTSIITVLTYVDFPKLPAIAKLMLKWKPIWLDHFERNRILDGDNVLLSKLQRKMGEPSSWRGKYLPVGDFDGFVFEIRKWMDDYRDSMPWISDESAGIELDTEKRRDELIERLYSHTMHCNACRGAMKGFERAAIVAEWIGKIAVVALINVFVSAYVGNATVLTGDKLQLVRGTVLSLVACIALAFYARQKFLWFKSQFIYSEEARQRVLS